MQPLASVCFFTFLKSLWNKRYLQSRMPCRCCGSERVKVDTKTVLSVLLGAVPAHRLLSPSLRREHRAGDWVCVAVCHSGSTHSHEKQPALLKTCCCLFRLSHLLDGVCGYINSTGAFYPLSLVVGSNACCGSYWRQRAQRTGRHRKHGRILQILTTLQVVVVYSLLYTVSL